MTPEQRVRPRAGQSHRKMTSGIGACRITNRDRRLYRAQDAASTHFHGGRLYLYGDTRPASIILVYTSTYRCLLHVRSDVPVHPGTTRHPQHAARRGGPTKTAGPAL